MQTTLGRDSNELIIEGLETILSPDKWHEAHNLVFKAAFDEVFRAQDKGKLQWKRVGDGNWKVIADIKVKNGKGKDVVVQVTFFVWYNDEASPGESRIGELKFSEKLGGPFLNTRDSRVRRLYEQITGEVWKGAS